MMKYLFRTTMTRADVMISWILAVAWGKGEISSTWELLAWIVVCAFISATGQHFYEKHKAKEA